MGGHSGWVGRLARGRSAATLAVVGLIAFIAVPDASASTAVHSSSAGGSSVRAAVQGVHATAGDPAGWNTNIDAGNNRFFNNSTTFNGISCPTPNICFAGGYVFSNAGDTTQLFESTDGGSSWAVVPEGTVSGAYIDDISCVSTTVCVEVGGNRPPGPTGQAAQIVVGSGVAATRSSVPAGTQEIIWVKCVSEGLCWADTTNGVGLRSADAGATWSVMPVVHSAGGRALYAEGMAFSSGPSGWLTAHYACPTSGFCRGFIEHTTDGGATWTLAATPANMPAMVNIQCPSSSECLAIGWTSLGPSAYMTYDGGAQWVRMALPHGLVYLNGVSCGDTNHCYITGEDLEFAAGTVAYATSNAGHSWTLQPIEGGAYAMVDVACTSALHCVAGGYWDGGAAISTTTNGGVPSQGYNFVASDGGVFNFNSHFFGSAGNIQLPAPIIGMARSSLFGGYWLAGADGSVYNFGAPFPGSLRGKTLNKPIVAIAGTRDGLGYDLVATDGGVFPFGDAHFFGSTGNVHLNKPIVGMAIDTQTGGYWLVASDGGIFDFNAPFLGSTGNVPLNKPIVGMAEDTATGGYWLVASDGGIFDFNAPFYGSTGAVHLNQPIVAMQPTPDDHGYWLIARDGGVFQFGDAKFYGSTGGVHLNQPIVGGASSS